MGVPGKIPFEGKKGALGRIAKAIRANRRAIDGSHNLDGETVVTHGIDGELGIGRVDAGGASIAYPENMSFRAAARQGDGENPAVEVRMYGGTVQGLFGALEAIKTTFWTPGGRVPALFDDYTAGVDALNSAAISDGEWFWLEYDPEGQEGERWSVEHGATLPGEATTEDAENARYFAIVPLFRVRLSVSACGVVQNHFGGVYVPTATNVIQVQESEE